MAKKKHKARRTQYRNAAPAAPRVQSAPRAPRASRVAADSETSLHRLGYTAAGAAGSALLGSFLKRQDWAPKTVATMLGVVGAGLAWKGDDPTIRSLGAGAMSAAGGQLAIELFADHERAELEKKEGSQATTAEATKPKSGTEARPSNTGSLPEGALQSAFERARLRYAIGRGEAPGIDLA